jgi:predicted RecB family endonuclease
VHATSEVDADSAIEAVRQAIHVDDTLPPEKPVVMARIAP